MELVTLDSNNQPFKPVENYDSLIWSERYNTTGDFQLNVGGDIPKFLQLLKKDTVVSLRESNVPMIVETHQIDRKKNTPDVLIIKGRAYDSILDRRSAIQSVSSLTGAASWNVDVRTPTDAAFFITNKICVEGLVDPLDIFEPAKVQFPTPTDFLTSGGPVKKFDIPRANLLSAVQTLIQTENAGDISTTPATPAVVPHGLRAVRPNSAGTAIAIEFYVGKDLRDKVLFDATKDLLDDGSYLFSTQGFANAAYGIGKGTAVRMYEGATPPSGLARRVILIDGSTSDISDPSVLREQMGLSLAEAHETAIFDGTINQDLSYYKFGVDYNLGDVVRVDGDYGLTSFSRVTEYIRSEDATGIKAYPTLSTIPA